MCAEMDLVVRVVGAMDGEAISNEWRREGISFLTHKEDNSYPREHKQGENG